MAYTLVQKISGSCSACTSGSRSVTSTGAGNLLIMTAGSTNGGNGNFSSLGWTGTNGGTWTIDTAFNTSSSSVFGASMCAYVLSSSAGGTTVTMNFTTSNTYRFSFFEYSFTGSSVSRDTSNAVIRGSATNQTGVSLTLTGTNDLIVRLGVQTATVNQPTIDTGYTIQTNDSGGGTAATTADLENTLTGSGPIWTYSTSVNWLEGAIAFAEAGGSPPTPSEDDSLNVSTSYTLIQQVEPIISIW